MNKLLWDANVPRVNEDFITRVSEEIEGRVPKKLSQEFSRTESRTIGAFLRLDEFLQSSEVRVCNPEPFREFPGTLTGKKQERNE